MTHILEVNPSELIKRAAEELKKNNAVSPPDWSKFVKTGVNRERVPDSPDWWYMRSAAILRNIAKLGPIGTEKLRTKYGGLKARGYMPAEFRKSSGSIIRKILQQLEKSQLIKQTAKGAHKGRVLTPQGMSMLDKLAIQIIKK